MTSSGVIGDRSLHSPYSASSSLMSIGSLDLMDKGNSAIPAYRRQVYSEWPTFLRMIPYLLNPGKISRFSQPLLGQFHTLFQGKSRLITQLAPCFFNAETRFAGQKAYGFPCEFRRLAAKF